MRVGPSEDLSKSLPLAHTADQEMARLLDEEMEQAVVGRGNRTPQIPLLGPAWVQRGQAPGLSEVLPVEGLGHQILSPASSISERRAKCV